MTWPLCSRSPTLFYRDGPAASPDLLSLGHIDAAPGQLAKANRITIQAAS